MTSPTERFAIIGPFIEGSLEFWSVWPKGQDRCDRESGRSFNQGDKDLVVGQLGDMHTGGHVTNRRTKR
jgi:hypothetical protein